MNELKSNLKHKKPNPVKDAAGLASLVGFLNNPLVTGAVVPREERAAAAPKETPIVEAPTPRPPVSPQAAAPIPQAPAPAVSITKVAFTGQLMSGKDLCAERAGLKIFSLAEPLYAIQKFFFGSDDKTLPGAREFLQRVGQWGRGEVNAQYPLTTERAMFINFARSRGVFDALKDYKVSWALFGADPELWLNALLVRVDDYLEKNPGARVGVTNARFNNEYARLTSEGFVPFHVMCSPATWTERLKKAGLAPESPAVKDLSESMAIALNQSVTKQLSAQRQGAKLRCIWSDDKVACPSPRLLTVPDFVALFPK